MACVEAEGASWPVPAGAALAAGQSVHYGIRPTDISIGAAGEGVPAKVVVVEPTGAETELLVQVGESKLVVVLHGRTAAQPDDIISLIIKTEKVHLFDGASEKRL
jgi:multiple sugar transport system ATP-binding protein